MIVEKKAFHQLSMLIVKAKLSFTIFIEKVKLSFTMFIDGDTENSTFHLVCDII